MLQQVILEGFAPDDFAATSGAKPFRCRFAGFEFWHGDSFDSTQSISLPSTKAIQQIIKQHSSCRDVACNVSTLTTSKCL